MSPSVARTSTPMASSPATAPTWSVASRRAARPTRRPDGIEQQYGERVDVAEFLEVLEDLDLVVRDGEEAAATSRPCSGSASVWPSSPRPAWVAYAAIVVAALVAMVRNHSLVPRYQHLFFTRSSLTILTLGIVLGQVPWMLLHEAFHALAGRRLGLNSKLRSAGGSTTWSS